MKKNTKLMLMLSIVGALLFVLVACGGNEEPAPPVVDTPTPGDTVEDPTPNAAPFEFSIMGTVWGDFPEDGGKIFAALEEATNTRVDLQMFPSDGFPERITTTLASGNLPDVIVAGADLAMLVNEGAIIPLDDLLEAYGQNILAALGDDIVFSRFAADGKIYALPNIVDYRPFFAMQVRTDWLDELGLDVPDTWDEWIHAWEQMLTLGNNIVPYAGDIYAFLPSFGLYTSNRQMWLTDADGNLTIAPEMPQFRAYLEAMNDLHNRGILDQEFAIRGTIVGNFDSVENALNAGIAGSVVTWATNTRTVTQNLTEINEDARLLGVLPVPGPDGHRGTPARARVSGSTAITIAGADRGREIIQFFDFLFTEEGRRLMSFGIEGETFEFVNGEPMLLPDFLNFTPARQAGINFTAMAHHMDGDAFAQLMFGGTVDQLTYMERIAYDANFASQDHWFSNVPNIGGTTAAAIEHGAFIFPQIEALIARTVIGELSIDEFFEQYDALRPLGLQAILDQATDAWARVR